MLEQIIDNKMCCLQIGAAKFYNWKGMHSDVKGMMALLLPLLTVNFFFYYKLPTRPTSNKPSILKNVRILHVGLFPSCRAGSSPLAASCTTMAIISTFMPQCHHSSVHHQLVRFLELGMSVEQGSSNKVMPASTTAVLTHVRP